MMSSRNSWGIPLSVADHEVHERRDEAHEERDLSAKEKPNDLTAAHLIGAQQVRRRIQRRPLVGVEEILLLELVVEEVVGEDRREDREDREEDEDHHGRDGQPVVAQLECGVAPEAPRWPDVGRIDDPAGGCRRGRHYATLIRGSTIA